MIDVWHHEHARAVRLAGASAGLQRAAIENGPDDATRFERALSLARQALGDAAAAAAWAEGQRLTLDESFDLAVSVASEERVGIAV